MQPIFTGITDMDMHNRQIITIAASLLVLCTILMASLFDGPFAALYLQPTVPTADNANFYLAIREVPRSVLGFMAVDLLFIFAYVTVFVALYAELRSRHAALALLAVVLGISTGVFDLLENNYLITYALQSLYGHPLSPPALPLIYLLASMKWSAAYFTMFLFGLLWPRHSKIDLALSLLFLSFPLLGALSIAIPELLPARPLPLILIMLTLVGSLRKEKQILSQ